MAKLDGRTLGYSIVGGLLAGGVASWAILSLERSRSQEDQKWSVIAYDDVLVEIPGAMVSPPVQIMRSLLLPGGSWTREFVINVDYLIGTDNLSANHHWQSFQLTIGTDPDVRFNPPEELVYVEAGPEFETDGGIILARGSSLRYDNTQDLYIGLVALPTFPTVNPDDDYVLQSRAIIVEGR